MRVTYLEYNNTLWILLTIIVPIFRDEIHFEGLIFESKTPNKNCSSFCALDFVFNWSASLRTSCKFPQHSSNLVQQVDLIYLRKNNNLMFLTKSRFHNCSKFRNCIVKILNLGRPNLYIFLLYTHLFRTSFRKITF